MLGRLGRYAEANEALNLLLPLLNRLSGDNKYKAIWTAWAYLIRAQMALSERHLPEAKSKCEEALSVMTGSNRSAGTEASIKATLGLVYSLSGSFVAGRKHCEESVTLAADSGDQNADSHLALAESLIESGDAKNALAAATLAQKQFAAHHRKESEWRAWLMAARASYRLADNVASRNYLSHAQSALDALRVRWGPESFDQYLARSDIASYRKKLSDLSLH
jgi:tetratricopeptide (TPR) repeat protein